MVNIRVIDNAPEPYRIRVRMSIDDRELIVYRIRSSVVKTLRYF